MQSARRNAPHAQRTRHKDRRPRRPIRRGCSPAAWPGVSRPPAPWRRRRNGSTRETAASCGPIARPWKFPPFALDGGEEPEIVGCYVIDPGGRPRRLGFALANEWSDHATEKISYLHLAPSKLRTCAVGPTLNTSSDFQDITLRCSVRRSGRTIYDSGELKSGEQFMCHALGNLEDHHFKYPQHRRPGDVHLHFFGTSRLSFGTRDWKFAADDEIHIEAPGFCRRSSIALPWQSRRSPSRFW